MTISKHILTIGITVFSFFYNHGFAAAKPNIVGIVADDLGMAINFLARCGFAIPLDLVE